MTLQQFRSSGLGKIKISILNVFSASIHSAFGIRAETSAKLDASINLNNQWIKSKKLLKMLSEFKYYSTIPWKTFVNPSKNDQTWSLQSSSFDNKSDFWMKYCIWNSAFMKYFSAAKRSSMTQRFQHKTAKSFSIHLFLVRFSRLLPDFCACVDVKMFTWNRYRLYMAIFHSILLNNIAPPRSNEIHAIGAGICVFRFGVMWWMELLHLNWKNSWKMLFNQI